MEQYKVDFLRGLSIEDVLIKALDAHINPQNTHEWLFENHSVELLGNNKWQMVNKTGHGHLELLEHYFSSKPQSEDDVFSSPAHLAISLLLTRFKKEMQDYKLLSKSTFGGWGFNEGSDESYDDLKPKSGINVRYGTPESNQMYQDTPFVSYALAKQKSKIAHVLQNSGDVNTLNAELNHLIRLVAEGIVRDIDNYKESCKDDLDEWSIGLGIAQNVIEEKYFPTKPGNKKKM